MLKNPTGSIVSIGVAGVFRLILKKKSLLVITAPEVEAVPPEKGLSRFDKPQVT